MDMDQVLAAAVVGRLAMPRLEQRRIEQSRPEQHPDARRDRPCVGVCRDECVERARQAAQGASPADRT
jgi:hypothetical protein